ncbi:HPr family phosphocarrier protein [Bifidobacterium adolescentis]|nr:HPr family phosphocarrier protein [Bifidobacterium adolescentis]
MGLGIKQGDTVVINVEGDNAEAGNRPVLVGSAFRYVR